jgi:hypothetical protein
VTTALRLTVIAYAFGLATCCAAAALSGRRRSPTVTAAIGILQVAVILQATLDVVAVASGDRPDSLSVHVAYLVASVLIIPIVVASMRLDPQRWGSASLAVGCVTLAIVCLRLDQTLRRS